MLPMLRIMGCGKMLFPKVQTSCLLTHTQQRSLMTSSYFVHQTSKVDASSRNTAGSYLHTSLTYPSSCYHRRDYSCVPTSHTTCTCCHIASDGRLLQSNVVAGLDGVSLLKVASSSRVHTSSSLYQVIQDDPPEPSWWRRHLAELRSAPTPAVVLGFSGLVPFMVPALYSIVTMSCGPNMAFAQVAYGACILSFLGGIRWGHTVSPSGGAASWPALTFSVVPSLIAWMGLMMPIQPGLFCIISGLAFAGFADTCFKAYPVWFRSLRFILTTFAIFSIGITFGFSILFPPIEPEHGYNFKKLIKIARIIVEE